jgi:hypothetical protein
MAQLKQSTTYTRAFLLVGSADHITGLTGASPSVSLSKAGGTFAAAGGAVTEIANGWYKIALTTTDTGTLGDLAYHITAPSADPTDFVDQVVGNILGDTLPANVTQISGSAVSTTAAQLGVNVVNYNGHAAVTDANNLPKVDLEDIAGAAVSTATAQLGVNAVNIAGQAAALDGNNRLKVDVDDWGGTAVGSVPPDVIFLRSGTAQAGAATSITLDASASATSNLYDNCVIFIRSGTGAGQSNIISAYNGSTKVATVSNSWATNPDSTSVFTIAAFGPVIASVSGTVTANVTEWNGSAVSAATAGIPDVNVKNFGTTAVTGRDIGASVLLSNGTGTGQISLSAGAVTVGTNNDKTGYALTSAEHTSISGDVWDALRSGHTVTGSFGQGVASVQGNVTGSVGSMADAGASLTSLGDTRIAHLDANVSSRMATFVLPTNFSNLSIDAGGSVPIQSNVKKNAQTMISFVMTDSTTNAPKTGLTVTATRSLDGGTFAACANAPVEISNGWYTLTLAASDMNAHVVALRFTATGANDQDLTIYTQP